MGPFVKICRSLAWRVAGIALAALLWGPPAAALQLGRSAPAPGDSISLAGEFSLLRDPGGDLTIEAASSPTRQGDFLPLPGHLDAGFTHDALWLRFTVSRSAATSNDWLLETMPSILDEVVLYSPDGRGGYTAMALGDRVPFVARPVAHRYFAFPLHLGETPQTYFIKLRTTSNMSFQGRLWREEGFHRHQNADYLLLGMFHGVVGIMAIFNLIFWIWLRDPLHLRYALYISSMSLLQFGISGLLAEWVFPSNPVAVDRSTGVLLCLQMAMAMAFLSSAFRFPTFLPRIARFFAVGVGYYLVVALLAAAGFYSPFAQFTTATSMVMAIANIGAAFWISYRHPEFRLLAMAFSVLLAAGSALFLRNLGMLQLGGSPDTLTTIGTLVHVVLLNFALANRIRTAEQSSREAEQNTLRAAREAEHQLENHVAERTEELATANQTLRREVAERAALEERLQAALADTHQALDTQKKFIAMVSHEFRNPLSVIDASSQTLAMVAAPEDGETHRRLRRIRNAVADLGSLLEACLSERRFEMRGFAPRLAPLDLRAMVAKQTCRFAVSRGIPIAIAREQDEQDDLEISGDAEMLAIALNNLLDNAAKYSSATPAISVSVGGDEESVWIEVADQGVGIAEADVKHIFNKFRRGAREEEGTSGIPGTGLGLYLVHSIVCAHGGSVTVDSRLGEGSRFRLVFRRYRVN